MSRFIRLFNGKPMPLVGMGTWQMTNPQLDELALETALDIGYRHFDTAYKYENEKIVGRAISKWLKEGKGKREDLFIVTKLPWIGMSPERVEHFINLSLNKLQMDYIDLYLMHWPFGLKYKGDDNIAPTKDDSGDLDLDMTSDINKVWQAMERQVDEGKARSIGLSNFNSSQIKRLMKISRIQPANLQVEVHAYFQQLELRQTCKAHDITVTAYGPLGSPGRDPRKGQANERNIPALMNDPTITTVAGKYGKTSSQILLRFLTQEDIAVIPKSSNAGRMTENLDVIANENKHIAIIFNFQMTQHELEKIRKLDKGETGRSFREFTSASSHPEYPFPS